MSGAKTSTRIIIDEFVLMVRNFMATRPFPLDSKILRENFLQEHPEFRNDPNFQLFGGDICGIVFCKAKLAQ